MCRAFFKEFLFFSVYMGAICVVCYAVQDPNSYPMARNIRDLCSRARVKGGLRFDQVSTARSTLADDVDNVQTIKICFSAKSVF